MREQGSPDRGESYRMGMVDSVSAYKSTTTALNQVTLSTDRSTLNLQDMTVSARHSVHGIRQIINDARILGIINDEQYETIRKMVSIMVITSSLAEIYWAVKLIIDALKGIHLALARTEMTAHLAAQDYAGVARAAGVSAAVVGSFLVAGGVSYAVSREIDLNKGNSDRLIRDGIEQGAV